MTCSLLAKRSLGLSLLLRDLCQSTTLDLMVLPDVVETHTPCVVTGRIAVPRVVVAFLSQPPARQDRMEVISVSIVELLRSFLYWISWPDQLRVLLASRQPPIGTTRLSTDKRRDMRDSPPIRAFLQRVRDIETDLDRLLLVVHSRCCCCSPFARVLNQTGDPLPSTGQDAHASCVVCCDGRWMTMLL